MVSSHLLHRQLIAATSELAQLAQADLTPETLAELIAINARIIEHLRGLNSLLHE